MGHKGCSCTMYVVNILSIYCVIVKLNRARVFQSLRAKNSKCYIFLPRSQNFFSLVTKIVVPSRIREGSESMLQYDLHFTRDAHKERFRKL